MWVWPSLIVSISLYTSFSALQQQNRATENTNLWFYGPKKEKRVLTCGKFIFCLFILYTDEKVIIDNIEEQKSEHWLERTCSFARYRFRTHYPPTVTSVKDTQRHHYRKFRKKCLNGHHVWAFSKVLLPYLLTLCFIKKLSIRKFHSVVVNFWYQKLQWEVGLTVSELFFVLNAKLRIRYFSGPIFSKSPDSVATPMIRA